MARYKWQDSEYGKIAGYGIKRPDPVGLPKLLQPYEEQIKALGTEEEKGLLQEVFSMILLNVHMRINKHHQIWRKLLL